MDWVHAIDLLHPKLAANGERLTTMIIKMIWTYILDTCKLRNAHLHNTVAQLDLPNYKQAVTTIYKQQHQLSTTAQAALYHQPIEVTLDQPAPKMQQWVTRGYNYFKQQLTAERKQAKLNTQDIRTFFQPLAQTNNDLQPL